VSLSLGLSFFAGVRQTVVAHALDLEDNKNLEVQGWEVGVRRTSEGRRDRHCPKCFFQICLFSSRNKEFGSCHYTNYYVKYCMVFCHCSNFSVLHFL